MPEFQSTAFGDYVLQDRIGAGGMAEIFLASAQGIEGFEKRLVIKRILPTLSDDEQFVRMFIEEAKLCVALRHPNIVQVYDLGVIDGQYYIAMEYVDGRDLLKTLAACGKKKIGFPTDIALYIVMEALKGLDYAHRLERPDGQPLGIIHRDVSPSNLLLSFEGEVKLGDFGIAKASTREKTATGILKGKFGYMAPEQVTGAPIDHRADVFAVGIVLYELLTGHRLFAGKNDLLVLERVRDARIDPRPKHYRPDLDDELEHLVLRALSRQAEDRFQNAGDLHDAIHDYVYRSRAMVGPPQLARFMQGLFLADPEEVARRNRVRLPPVPHPDAASMPPEAAPERNVATRGAPAARAEVPPAEKSISVDLPDHFSDKTPFEISEASSSLSAVYISDEYDWQKHPSARVETAADEARLVEPQPLGGPADQERTVQTDVGIEVSDADVEAIAPGSNVAQQMLSDASTTPQPLASAGPSERYVETQTPDPKGEVMALRRAREADDPTDFDLQDDPGYLSQDDVQLVAAPTRDDMAALERPQSIATELSEEDIDSEDFTRTGSDTVEPAAIVERTRITPEEEAEASDEALTAEAEPTVQFDSTIYPALADDPVDISEPEPPPEATHLGPPPAAPTAPMPVAPGPVERVHLLDGAQDEYIEEDERSDFGTMEVEQSDMPTAEVSDADLGPLTQGPEEGTEVSFAPVPPNASTTPSDELPAVPFSRAEPSSPWATQNAAKYLAEPEDVHVDEDETLLRDDDNGELAALIAKQAAAAMPVEAMSDAVLEEAEDEASRTDLYNPVEEGMVAELAARAASAPARRQPFTGSRPRPVLLPADGSAPAPRPATAAFGRRRSSPRRRVATRAPLSVVNPAADERRGRQSNIEVREEPAERAVSTIPAPVVTPGQQTFAAAPPSAADPFEADDRANTGAGSLVDVEAYHDDDTRTGAGRRASSGVTSALDEAALVDEEIAELRKSSVAPRDRTTAGQLAESAGRPISEIDLDEATMDGHGSDLRSAILRRQSRRRMVTRSFVLYDDDKDKETARGQSATFAEDSEQSVPALREAGQLDDEGASELFGVLSVLDEEPPGFEPDEELSMETDARLYPPDLSDSFGVRTETPPPRLDSAEAQAAEFGHTSLGSLNPDDTGAGPMIDYGPTGDEPTASVTDGQVLSISQARGILPEADVVDGPAEMSGMDLEFTDDGLFSEHTSSRAQDPSSRGELLDDHYGEPGHFSEHEEPTQEQSRDESTGIGLLRPEISEAELTSGERPSHRGGLVSESFDFGSDQQERWRQAYDEPADGGTPDLPVRPESWGPPSEGMDATASQLASPEEMAPKGRGNLSVLRAVVERQRVARERNRAPAHDRGTADGLSPSPAASLPPAGPTAASPAASVPSMGGARAAPSVGQVYPPAAKPKRDKGRAWNTASYLLVAVAIALAVAAAVSSMLMGGDGNTPIPAQPERKAGLVDAPDDSTQTAPPPKAPEPAGGTTAPADRGTDSAETETPEKKADAPPPASKPDAPARSAARDEAAKPDTAVEPAPKKAKPTKKRRRRARTPRRRKAAPKTDGSKAKLRLSCDEPIDVRISTVGTRRAQTKMVEVLAPGWYRITLSRDGDRLSKMDVQLLAGQSVSIPCP